MIVLLLIAAAIFALIGAIILAVQAVQFRYWPLVLQICSLLLLSATLVCNLFQLSLGYQVLFGIAAIICMIWFRTTYQADWEHRRSGTP
jgi:multidrug transporter EmrE-like cation transporter